MTLALDLKLENHTTGGLCLTKDILFESTTVAWLAGLANLTREPQAERGHGSSPSPAGVRGGGGDSAAACSPGE